MENKQSASCEDVTVSDTLTQLYMHETSQTPGAAAEAAAERKKKHVILTKPIVLVCSNCGRNDGALSKDGMDFLCELGRRITQSRDDHRENAFLFQRLSVLIQR